LGKAHKLDWLGFLPSPVAYPGEVGPFPKLRSMGRFTRCYLPVEDMNRELARYPPDVVAMNSISRNSGKTDDLIWSGEVEGTRP